MALFNKLNSSFSNLRLWEINETEDELRNNLNLSESSNSKFDKLKVNPSLNQVNLFLLVILLIIVGS